jgi:hypothetical protein
VNVLRLIIGVLLLSTLFILGIKCDTSCSCDPDYEVDKRCQESCEIYNSDMVKVEFIAHGYACWCERVNEQNPFQVPWR